MSNPVQVEAWPTTIEHIMRAKAFRQGVEDARAGRKPRFDEGPDQWGYERGRQFGVLAPRNLKLRVGAGGRLNPVAVAFFRMHNEDIL